MTERLYLLISGAVFALGGCLHLLRIISQWSIQVGAWEIPFGLSWLVIIGASALSIWAFRLSRLAGRSPRISH